MNGEVKFSNTERCAHLAISAAGLHDITSAQRAHSDEHCGNRAGAFVEVGLDDGAARVAVRVGHQLLHLRHQQHGLQQRIYAVTLLCADLRMANDRGASGQARAQQERHSSVLLMRQQRIKVRFFKLVSCKAHKHVSHVLRTQR